MLNRQFVSFFLAIVILFIAMLACGPQATTLPLPTPTTVATEETGQPALEPGATPTRSTRAQPLLGTPLSAQAVPKKGPWLVFTSGNTLWATSADGSGAALLDSGYKRITSPVAAPSGGHAAYITARTGDYSRLELHLLSLPSGKVETLTALTSIATAIDPKASAEDLPGSPRLEIARAILDVPSLAWSPDGSKLAFIGAMKGASADLYVYSLSNGLIKQLTSGPSQGYRPTWSPDGKVIVHAGADSFGTGAGYAMAGVWAASADGSGVKTLYKPDSGDEVFVGWVANNTFLAYSWDPGCGPGNLRLINVDTAKSTPLWPGALSVQGLEAGVAYDPAAGSVLIALDEFTADAFCTGDGQPKKPGLYLINIKRPTPLYISDVSAFAQVWNSKSARFFAGTEEGAISIASNGAVVALPAPTSAAPAVSPDGRSWAWSSSGFGDKPAGLWIGPLGQKAPTRVIDDAVYSVTWSPDSRRVFFFADDGLYAADRSDNSVVLVLGVRSTSDDADWVMP